MRWGWCTLQNTSTTASRSGTQAARPHKPMPMSMLNASAPTRLLQINKGLAGSSSWRPGRMIIGGLQGVWLGWVQRPRGAGRWVPPRP